MIKQSALPDGWRWVRLGDVCNLAGESLNPQQRPLEVVAHYSIPAYDAGRVPIFEPGAMILSNKMQFPRGAVLFSKLNPRISRVWHVNDDHPHPRICSTEFLPLVPKAGILSPVYLTFILQEPEMIAGLRTRVAAATKSRERLKPEIVLNAGIPLPTLEEQKEIAATLNEQMGTVERARAAAEAQLEAAKALPAAYLRAVFSSPEAQHWPKMRFDDVAVLQRGYDLPSHVQVPGDYPIITSSGKRGTHSEYKHEGPGVIVGRSGSIGKVCFVSENYWPHNTALFVKDFKGNDPRYIFYLLQWLDVRSVGSGSGVPTLDRKEVHRLLIGHPNIEEQTRIAAMLNEQMASAGRTRKAIEEELDAINKLPAALLRRAFSGGL